VTRAWGRHLTRSRVVAGALILGAAVSVWLWRHATTPQVERANCARCNLLLITVDTLRTDRVGAFGSTRHLTPTLDRFAAQGLRFTRAYASAPLTLPSHASIMTALSPPAHGVRNNSLFRLGAGPPTLAGVLASHGYRTGAFVGAFVLDARFGLNRGFDVYDDKYGEKHEGDATEGAERQAGEVVKPATAWILGAAPRGSIAGPAAAGIQNGTASPWFAWVHLYDPHEPYRAPEPYASEHEPYDAEVAYTDAMVGKLLGDLAAAGQLDRTLLAFTADHGESLGEHGEATHGVFVYDVTMRVPSFLWAGARIGGRTYGGLTRLIDLAPTILDMLGVDPPPAFEGRSLLPAINDPGNGRPSAYLEAMDANLTRNWAPLTGLVNGPYKLIDLPIPELYDLRSDPGETTNVFARDPERARALEALLRDGVAQLTARGSGAERPALNTEARQRLQALGYVASAAAPGTRIYTDADDPKRLIGVSNDLNRAVGAFKSGRRDEAMAAVRAIIRDHPSFTTPYGVLASMQHDTGDLPGAIAALEDVVRRGVADQSVMVVLAGYLLEAGALERSAGLLEAVIAAHPDYADAYNSLGVVYSRLGRHDAAHAALRRVLELDPTSATAFENLGVDELARGDLDAAAADLTRAADLDPALAGAHNALGAVSMRRGQPEEALGHWRRAVDLNPRLYDALYNLGVVLHDAGRRDEARPYLERFVRDAPPARYAGDIARVRVWLSR
jgi:arylsulfatase A-like enzyme/Tfp pilus assembly protein PilF